MTRPAVRIGIVLVVALTLAAAFAVAGRASDPRFDSSASLGPSIVDAHANVLYKAQWIYLDNQTLTHPSVAVTVPAGWMLVDAAPDVCSQSGTTITCPRGTIRAGAVVNQEVELQTAAADLNNRTVNSELIFYEGPRNPGRLNHAANDDNDTPLTTTNVISADETVEPNRAGKCVDQGGGDVFTATGVGGSATNADVPATNELCTPVSIEERGRTNPTEACFGDFVCQTDIVTTNAGNVGTADPIILTLTFYGQGLNTNLPLIFISNAAAGQVQDCTGAGATPDPCIQSNRSRQQSLTRVVRWSGLDPTWTD
jgi:hypothetical protein